MVFRFTKSVKNIQHTLVESKMLKVKFYLITATNSSRDEGIFTQTHAI